MPECCNSLCELSQHMSNPGKEHWVAMTRFVGYLKGKGEHTLLYKPPIEYRSMIYADSNYATNIDNRRSVSGMVNTIGDMITSWASKTQMAATPSSTEAEYVSLVACAQETIFQNQLLSELGSCNKPGIIKEDNTGAIFLVNNKQVSSCTKHIAIRHHFIREQSERGEVKAEFV